MIINVELWAFTDGQVRPVEIPDGEVDPHDVDALLEKVFHYGQNDFQPKQFPSVSVGDVILFNTHGGKTRRFMVKGAGFEEVNEDVYLNYIKLPKRERVISQL